MDDKTREMMWEALGVRTDKDPTEYFAVNAKLAIEEATCTAMPGRSTNAAEFFRKLGVEFDANNKKFQALVKLTTEWRQKLARPSSWPYD